MKKIDNRSAQVHFLFEGLLAGEIQSITPQQREILLMAMEKAFNLSSRRKQVEKIEKREQPAKHRSFNQEGRQGKRTKEFEEVPTRAGRFVIRIKQACYIVMFLLAVVLGYSLYIQYF